MSDVMRSTYRELSETEKTVIARIKARTYLTHQDELGQDDSGGCENNEDPPPRCSLPTGGAL